MRTLYVLRHAKSSWKDFQGNDHDRPLTSKGLQAAPLMGKVLVSLSPPPSLIMTSTAQRAQQTATLVLEELNQHCDNFIEVIADPQIYGASVVELFNKILKLPNECDAVVLIGHNPVLEGLVSLLTFGEVDGNIHMSSATLANITFGEESWGNIQFGSGLLNALIFPKLVKELVKDRSKN